ncbi:MAG: hypothetical protein IPM92_09130 [Saprospiraceae bacterium]|nr:hypothetical protein [Saprospiraceae bacterium]
MLPEVYSCFGTYKPGDVLDDIYDRCPSISIDYAVMEKTDKAFVLPVDFGWSDLGTWASLYELQGKDNVGNVILVRIFYFAILTIVWYRNEENKIIALQGLNHLIIVNTAEALLICEKSQEQAIKQMVAELQTQFGNSVL